MQKSDETDARFLPSPGRVHFASGQTTLITASQSMRLFGLTCLLEPGADGCDALGVEAEPVHPACGKRPCRRGDQKN